MSEARSTAPAADTGGTAEPQPKTTLTVTVDGVGIEANPGELVIAAAERHGVYIPRFCYHNRMRPVGMCRMCLVEIDAGRGPALQPACMIPVTEGMTVDTRSARTRKAQEGVLEFLLLNHPLDCPVCDKGGECPLQDQTLAYGPGESRFVDEKRHYEKPIALSDLVLMDRERCILCDRCTRFADEVAGDPLISFIGRGANTEVNTFPDHPFASYFSGNTIQICPVGALTSAPYRFRARPWDLEEVSSTCQTCSVGCAATLQSSRNRLLRMTGIDDDAVNWGWLCDRGRFNIDYVHSPDRLGEPLVREGGQLRPVRWAQAMGTAARAIATALADKGPGSVACLGGARLTNESQYAWAKLAKGVIGTDHVDAQLGDGLPASLVLGLPRATIAQACTPGGTVVLVGCDPKEELPVLHLRLRHAVVNDGARLVEVGPTPSGLAPHASSVVRCLPGDVADAVRGLVDRGTLRDAPGPVTVIVGGSSITEEPAGLAAAASLLHGALPEAGFLFGLRRGNVFGALDMGLAPGLLPGRVGLEEGRSGFVGAGSGWAALADQAGHDAVGILRAAAEGRIEVLVLLGADPIDDFPDRQLAERALEGAGTVVAVDQFLTASSSRADVVLAAAGWSEVDGTTTNLEGRVLPVAQKVTPPGTARADWMIASELASRLGADLGFDSVDGIWDEIRSRCPSHADVEVTPVGRRAAEGRGVEGTDGAPAVPAAGPVARGSRVAFEPTSPPAAQPLDPSALRLVARRRLYDGATTTQRSSSLAPLAPEPAVLLHPEDFAGMGIAAGSPVEVSSATGTLTLAARPDPSVGRGTAVVTANLAGAEVNRVVSIDRRVTDVRLDPGRTGGGRR